jgi:hypothetical protein
VRAKKRPRVPGQEQLFATRKLPTGKKKDINVEEHLEAAGVPEFHTEFQFAGRIGREWAFDYAWPDLKIALEIEGGGFGRYVVIQQGHERRKGKSIPIKSGIAIRFGGRHNTGAGLQADAEKYNRAAILGWLVIRATTTMVRDGDAIRDLVDAFHARGITDVHVPDLPRPASGHAVAAEF